ncbi:MAG: hypothetical protein H6861_01085 [Rhodospirillales bacterium]|nr:hypothetical protein [Rhodospirillales bacterium]
MTLKSGLDGDKIPTDMGKIFKGDLDRAASDVYLALNQNIVLNYQEIENIKKVVAENHVMLKLEVIGMIDRDVRIAEGKVQEIIDLEKQTYEQDLDEKEVTKRAKEIFREIDEEIEGDFFKELAKQVIAHAVKGRYKEVPSELRELGDKISNELDETIRSEDEQLLKNEKIIPATQFSGNKSPDEKPGPILMQNNVPPLNL